MPKLTDELNQLSGSSLEMAMEIGRILKKKNFTHQDLKNISYANFRIEQACHNLKDVSHET